MDANEIQDAERFMKSLKISFIIEGIIDALKLKNSEQESTDKQEEDAVRRCKACDKAEAKLAHFGNYSIDLLNVRGKIFTLKIYNN